MVKLSQQLKSGVQTREYRKSLKEEETPKQQTASFNEQDWRDEQVRLIDQKIIELENQKIAEAEKFKRQYEERRQQARAETDPRSRERKELNLVKLEDRYEEKEVYLSSYIQGLREGKEMIKKGQNISFKKVSDYGKDLGKAYKERETTTNERRRASKEAYENLIRDPEIPNEERRALIEQKQADPQFFINYDLSDQQKTKAGLIKSSQERVKAEEKARRQNEMYIQLVNEARQEEAIRKRKEERQSQPVYIDYEEVATTLPYRSRGTSQDINTYVGDIPSGYTQNKVASPDFISKSDKIKIEEYAQTKTISYQGVNILKKIGGYVDSKIPNIIPKFVSEADVGVSQYLSDQRSTKREETLEQTGIKKKLDDQLNAEAQLRFEDKYYDDIVRGVITQEEAEQKFYESDDARILSYRYTKEAEQEVKNLGWRSGEYRSEVWQNIKYFPLDIATLLTPKTTGELTSITIGTYGALTVAKGIPAKAVIPIEAGFTGYGVYEAVAPNKSPEERASGIITAGISGTALTYSVIKYLKTPTIRTAKIDAPRSMTKLEGSTANVQVKQQTFINEAGQKVTRASYESAKISEQTVAGRRTIVSTKGRDLLGKATGDVDKYAIYKGQSYAKPDVKVYDSLRGSYTVTELTPRQKAFNLLKKYYGVKDDGGLLGYKSGTKGLTDPQIDDLLRTYQPRIITKDFSGTVDIIRAEKGQTIIRGEGDIVTKQIKVTVDRDLGLKTRYARSYVEVFESRITPINIKGREFYVKEFDRSKFFLEQGRPFQKVKDAGKNRIISREVSTIVEERDFQLIKVTREIGAGKQIYPAKSGIYKSNEAVFSLKTKPQPQVIDLREITGVSIQGTPKPDVTPVKPPRTTDLKELLKTLEGIYGDKGTTAKVSKTGKTGKTKAVTQQVSTGTITEQIGKISLSPIEKVKVKIKDITKFTAKSGAVAGSKLGLSSVTGLLVRNRLRTDPAYNTDVAEIEDYTQELKIETTPKVLEKTGYKTITKPELKVSPITFTPRPPPIAETPLPDIVTKPIEFDIDLPKGKAVAKKKKKGKRVRQFAYLPDFTSRALGLKPDVISGKDATARVNKILTGLEIRRGVKIK